MFLSFEHVLFQLIFVFGDVILIRLSQKPLRYDLSLLNDESVLIIELLAPILFKKMCLHVFQIFFFYGNYRIFA